MASRPAGVPGPGVPHPAPARNGFAPQPAHIRQIGAGVFFRGYLDTDVSRTPSRLACRTQPVWQYQTVPALSGPLAALPGTSRVRLPSASPPCCDRTEVVVFHLHSIDQRIVAHAPSEPCVNLSVHTALVILVVRPGRLLSPISSARTSGGAFRRSPACTRRLCVSSSAVRTCRGSSAPGRR
jgi:hypothetical protein